MENILFPDKIKPDSEEIVKEQKMNQVDSPELSEQRTDSISAKQRSDDISRTNHILNYLTEERMLDFVKDRTLMCIFALYREESVKWRNWKIEKLSKNI